MDDEATLEQRLAAGEWLTTGEAGVLLRASRWAVIRATQNGWRIGGVVYELHYDETPGGHRRCDPDDLGAILAAKGRARADQEEKRAKRLAQREQNLRDAVEKRRETARRTAEKAEPQKPTLEEVRADIRAQRTRKEISAETAAEMLRLTGEVPAPRADQL